MPGALLAIRKYKTLQEEPEGPSQPGHGGALLVSQLGTLRVKDYKPPKAAKTGKGAAPAVGNERDGAIQMHCDANSRCDVVTMLLLTPPA